MRIVNRKLHLITGKESTLTLFRNSRDLSTAPSTILVIENLFGSPASCRPVYENDNTGIYSEPAAGSRPIKPQNRIYYGIHKALHANLAGPGLADLATRFIANLITEIEQDTNIGFDEWVEIPDLYAHIQKMIFKSSTSALCGPYFFSLNPDITEDFWKFDSSAPGLFKLLPRFMIPESFAVRDKLHASVKKWHRHANEHFDWNDEELDKEQWEPYFGAKIMRERQRLNLAIEGFNADAIAATDLGMIWA